MKIIKTGNKRQATCEHCGTIVQPEVGDLNWTHAEEEYYYVTCPICGQPIWIKCDIEWDEMWHEQLKNNKY